jgi:transcriptional antiterminator RfaH
MTGQGYGWFAVSTQVRAEARAQLNLERQGFDVYLPRYLKTRRHARRVDQVPMPLFPRYLFVGMDTRTARWRAINSTFGVSQLVASGGAALRVPQHVIETIRQRENGEGWVSMDQYLPAFSKGDKVQIKNGPLTDQVGLFDCIDDQERVFILLDLMGRAVKVRVDAEQIGAIA